MKILAIETSGPVCSVAVGTWGTPPRTLAEAQRHATFVQRRGHSEHARHAEILFGLIEAVLGKSRLAGITGIAVSIGPGSFTGLRVGLAAAKTFARFGRIPLAGISTLEALAATQPATGHPVVATVDAMRGEVYAAVYRASARGMRRAAGPWILDPAALDVRTPAGAVRVAGQPEAAMIAILGAIRLGGGKSDDPDRLVPVYLREPEAVVKRKARLGRR